MSLIRWQGVKSATFTLQSLLSQSGGIFSRPLSRFCNHQKNVNFAEGRTRPKKKQKFNWRRKIPTDNLRTTKLKLQSTELVSVPCSETTTWSLTATSNLRIRHPESPPYPPKNPRTKLKSEVNLVLRANPKLFPKSQKRVENRVTFVLNLPNSKMN